MKVKIVSIVIFVATMTASLFIVAKNLPFALGSFHFVWGPLALLMIFVNKPIVFAKRSMQILLIYGLIFLGLLHHALWPYMLEWDRNNTLSEYYALITFMAFFNYYIITKNFREFALLGQLGFVFMIITVITTHIVLIFDPMIIRMSASPGTFSDVQLQLYERTGAGGYGFMQAMVCILPILVYHIKYNKRLIFNRNVLFVILFLILFLHIRTQVFANLMVAIGITTFSFVGLKNAKRSLIPMTVLVILFLFIPLSIVSDVLLTLSQFFDPTSDTYFKLTDLALFIEFPEIDPESGIGHRAQRYPDLIDLFLSNPVFGMASSASSIYAKGGGHLHWMNRLTFWGVFGFSFYIFVLYYVYNTIRKLFDDNYGFYYFLAVASFIVLGLFKTIAGREIFLVLIVILPGLYYLPLLRRNKNQQHQIFTNNE
jgi:hypothetical protein